jgi:hypothetical protein
VFGGNGNAMIGDSNVLSRYGGIGDHLWVREALRRCQDSEGSKPLALYDCDRTQVYDAGYPVEWHWKPSVLTARYMPRWASRITLEVTGLRVERLQDISENDAKSEGVPQCPAHWKTETPYRKEFERVWNHINAKRYPWELNPWVWVISFKQVKG